MTKIYIVSTLMFLIAVIVEQFTDNPKKTPWWLGVVAAFIPVVNTVTVLGGIYIMFIEPVVIAWRKK